MSARSGHLAGRLAGPVMIGGHAVISCRKVMKDMTHGGAYLMSTV